jgi:hypothetical protein
MQTEHDIPTYPLSIAAEPQERLAAGERVSELMEHPGWADLRRGLRAFQEAKALELMNQQPSQDGSVYADLVGEMRGASMIEQIAAGLIEVGQHAAEELRSEED